MAAPIRLQNYKVTLYQPTQDVFCSESTNLLPSTQYRPSKISTTAEPRYSATLTQRRWNSVTGNSVSYSISTHRHARYSATNCGKESVALYRS